MIPGYNHNIKYKEQICHIQTEDSGVENPHIITHLFVGGNIIESRKTSYADIVGSEGQDKAIVELMQNQHKAIIKALIKGQLDEPLAIRSKNAAMLNGPAPLNVDAGQHSTSFGMADVGGKAAPAPAATQPPAAATPPPVAQPPAGAAPPPLPPAQPAPAIFGSSSADDGLENSLISMASSFFGDAPPPETFIEAETLQKAFDSNDESVVDSIFGEDLISEKSLDEVILSYLAEDMQK